MKGIILSGGAGSRLYPLTLVNNKQLQPVYDKPMVYYPLTTLLEQGIRDIAIINTPTDSHMYQALLGDGSRFGCKISYFTQDKPRGIAEAFIICKEFIGESSVALILGDNIYGPGVRFISKGELDGWSGARIFGYWVTNPKIYGVVEFDENKNVVSLAEKPLYPKSNYAIPGFYVYDNSVVDIAENLQPSTRGELEITDVNIEYLQRKELQVRLMPRGSVWLDAGSSASLHDSSAYVHTIEMRQGIKIGCPEEMAYRKKYIAKEELVDIINDMPKCEYRQYLENLK
ncbi:glucose-1-phosphate thymidylyltransferase RfbA [bacterium]|nr:glucose-1-phosphate thymidylyltransferase RfbA [bacterium]